MGSSLKSKLSRLSASSAPRPAPPPPALMEYVARFPAEQALRCLPASALRRMDFDGPFDPARALFLDTETTGLSGGAGTVAFLVGLGRVEGDQFVVRQYLMPTYATEPALLEAVARLAQGCDTVVTFNGKSFDVPLLASRCVMNRMSCPLSGMRHLDLIHPARRAWKLRLKDCSLANLEEKTLGVHREHDLPGAEVPQRYFDFLKSGDMSLLTDVVDHNRQDIVSLGTLLTRLAAVYAAPAEQTSMLDVFSLGRALEKKGELQEARRCYRLAAHPGAVTSIRQLNEARISPLANRNLSLLLRRAGNQPEAEGVWQEMIRRGQEGAFPYVELAKMREHRDRDWSEALRLTERALAMAADETERELLLKRKARLERRLQTHNAESAPPDGFSNQGGQ